MRSSPVVAASLVGVALTLIATTGPLMSRVEQPHYTVERADGPIELRAYQKMTVATTVVSGSRGVAVNKGFRLLANYIFGGNEGSKKIEMTAPVLQGSGAGETQEKRDWTIRFVMPRAWSKETLPRPQEQRVTLETMPAATFAVIRFSGFWRDSLLAEKTRQLEAFIARNKLTAIGGPIFAFYNPPWTLPFFRRNEVMIEVKPQ